MKNKFKFLAAVFSLMMFFGSFAACSLTDSNPKNELTFLTFNICSSSSSGKDSDKATSWTQRKEEVLKLINNSGAHVIALQEVSNWDNEEHSQCAYFENNLNENYELVYFGKDVALATIYDKTVFNLLSQEKYWFSDTPDVESNGWDGVNYRAAATLILEHKATGEKVRAINSHGPLDDTGNVKAYELVAERSLSGENDPFTVMMGDFNATPNKLGYVPIAEKLQDCRLSAKESPNRESRTWNGYKDTAKGILDYCFVSKSENVEILTYRVRDEKWGEGNYISDHFAVQVSVKMAAWAI